MFTKLRIPNTRECKYILLHNKQHIACSNFTRANPNVLEYNVCLRKKKNILYLHDDDILFKLCLPL